MQKKIFNFQVGPVCVFIFVITALVVPVRAGLIIPEEWTPTEARLVVTNNLDSQEKELIIKPMNGK